MTNTELIAIALGLVAADWAVGTLKALVSDHVHFSLQLLPKQFLLTMPLASTGLMQLASLQGVLTGSANTGATAVLVTAAGTISIAMLNDIRNKVSSWIQGTPNLSTSTSEALLGVAYAGINSAQNKIAPTV